MKIFCSTAPIQHIGELKVSGQLCPEQRQLLSLNLAGSDWIWIRCYSPEPEAFVSAKKSIDLHIEINDQHWHSSVYKATHIDDGSECNLLLECRWEGQGRWRNQRHGIFYGSNIEDMIQHHLEDKYRYTSLQNLCNADDTIRYPWHPSLTQWQESDGAFSDRQLKRHGVWHYFWHDKNGVELRLGDSNFQLAHGIEIDQIQNTLSNANSTGLVVEQEQTANHNNIAQLTYWQMNEADPQQPLKHTESCKSNFPNNTVTLPSPFTQINAAQLRCLTQNAADSIRLRQSFIRGRIQNLNLQPGQRFEMNDKQYVMQEVFYDFVHCGFRQYKTNHRFLAYELNHPYRPYFDAADDYKKQPRIIGHMTNVKTRMDDDAENNTVIPDRWGRVPLQLPLNFTVNGSENCRYIRRCDMLNSTIANSSFPLYGDSNCVLMFADDDPDRPVLIGCVSDENTGHIFEGVVDEKSELRLPTGQYFQHSNHPGFNEVRFGTRRNTVLMQNDPSKTDTLWRSDGAFCCAVGGSYVETFGQGLWMKSI